jgi:hypothetical protein
MNFARIVETLFQIQNTNRKRKLNMAQFRDIPCSLHTDGSHYPLELESPTRMRRVTALHNAR